MQNESPVLSDLNLYTMIGTPQIEPEITVNFPLSFRPVRRNGNGKESDTGTEMHDVFMDQFGSARSANFAKQDTGASELFCCQPHNFSTVELPA
jgi:hypothetical protein